MERRGVFWLILIIVVILLIASFFIFRPLEKKCSEVCKEKGYPYGSCFYSQSQGDRESICTSTCTQYGGICDTEGGEECELPEYNLTTFCCCSNAQINQSPFMICPKCPEPENWSVCLNSKQTQLSYTCDETTNYTCLPIIEEKQCESKTCSQKCGEENKMGTCINIPKGTEENVTCQRECLRQLNASCSPEVYADDCQVLGTQMTSVCCCS